MSLSRASRRFASLADPLELRATVEAGSVVYTFLAEGEEAAAHWTCGGLDAAARAVAARLVEFEGSGERALLLYPPGLEFIAAFFGCIYAGAIAVPAYPPRLNRTDPRLLAIARDARPKVILTTSALLARRGAMVDRMPELGRLTWIATDEIPEGFGDGFDAVRATENDLAFLQYTSGSTSTPRGVMVSHGNLLHNEECIRKAFGQDESSVVVGWLPMYHDMGLIGNVLQPLFSGGRCVLMSPQAFLQRPARWLEAIGRYQATTSGGPNFAYELCLAKVRPEDRSGLDLSSWRLAYSGAEPVRADSLARFAAAFAEVGFRAEAFYPCYGLAEATLFATGGSREDPPHAVEVQASDLEQGRGVPVKVPGTGRTLVSCGRPWEGQRLEIVDPETRCPVAEGQVGEIWIAGPSVAGGYWDRPEATEELFLARLVGGEGPFLRTGDLGLLLAGELFVTGRRKDLIILRGRNLYPQDLEATIEDCHPALRRGSGAAFAVEIGDEERLVVVQELERRREEGDLHAVAERIRRAVLAEHEILVHEVVLIGAGTIPKTSSGKIQRHACRRDYLDGTLQALVRSPLPATGGGAEVAAPSRSVLLAAEPSEREGALVAYLAALIAEVGGISLPPGGVAAGDSLSGLGVDSLHAAEIQGRLAEDLGVPVPWEALLGETTLGDLGRQLTAALPGAPEPTVPQQKPMARWEPGRGQRALWFLDRHAGAGAAYNLFGAAWLNADVDEVALRGAFERLVERHPCLRARFPESGGAPSLRIEPDVPLFWGEVEMGQIDSSALLSRLASDAHLPLDLASGPLVRVRLYRGAEGRRALLVVVHHAAADFWSFGVIANELGALYGNETLVEVGGTYSEFVAAEEQLLAGPVGSAHLDYWSERFAEPPTPFPLPTDRPRPASIDFAGAALRFAMGGEPLDRLRAWCRTFGTTTFSALVAAYFAGVARYSGESGFAVGVPTSSRSRRLANVVGYCINPVPLRVEALADESFAGLAARVRAELLGALAHRELPFSVLAERLGGGRDAARMPIFQTTVSLQPTPPGAPSGLGAFALGMGGHPVAIGKLGLETIELPFERSPFELSLDAAELGDSVELMARYATTLFDRSTIERFGRGLLGLMAAAAAAPDRPLSSLPWLADGDRAQLVAADPTVPSVPGLLELLARGAAGRPDACAVSAGQESLNYRDLHSRAAGLAAALRRIGVGPEDRVAIFLPPSADALVAILAVLWAGGAYVPLDPSFPAERLAVMRSDSGVRAVLTRSEWHLHLPPGPGEVLYLDRSNEETRDLAPPPDDPAGLAYVLFTSGSTGRPKGVQVSRGALANFLLGMAEILDLGPSDLLLAVTPLSFDISNLEMLLPLVVGARLAFAPREVAIDGRRLADELGRTGATAMQATPATWRLLVEADWRGSDVAALCGGEALGRDLAQALAARTRVLWNLYGPTETTIWSSAGRAAARDPIEPLGAPIRATELYVVDRNLAAAPVGAPGELLIGGSGLARGYIGRPDLTAERFVPDGFGRRPGERLYRTGDRVRLRPDLALEYLGRLDNQVKIRGYRIEIGEIEDVLARHPAVGQAVVVAAGEGENRRLVAAVVRRAEVSVEQIRAHLRTTLPEYMIPAQFSWPEALPLTPNGKVDRRRLAELSNEAGEGSSAISGLTTMEQIAATLWRDLLGREVVGPRDDFFDLGGHSLLAARLIGRTREVLGVEVSLASLFRRSTLEGYAATLEELLGSFAGSSEIPRCEDAAVQVPSPGQERIWWSTRLFPDSASYNMAADLGLVGRLDVSALENAIDRLVARHEPLRTAFFPVAPTGVRIELESPRPMRLPIADLGRLGGEMASLEGHRIAAATAAIPGNLAILPLLRCLLLRGGASDHRLVVVVHHLAADEGSIPVFLDELGTIYRALVEGETPQLPELPRRYGEYASWQRSLMEGPAVEAALAHWRERLADAVALDLPTDRPRSPALRRRGGRLGRLLAPEVGADLEAYARRQGATPFIAMLATFHALLWRIASDGAILIGSPFSHRDRREF